VNEAVVVQSVDEEDAVLGACACGQAWHLAAEEVVPIRNRWYDALVVRCSACGEVRRAVFDITAFFEPPSRAWLRLSA
jgi:uncharacterized Zn finger protein